MHVAGFSTSMRGRSLDTKAMGCRQAPGSCDVVICRLPLGIVTLAQGRYFTRWEPGAN